MENRHDLGAKRQVSPGIAVTGAWGKQNYNIKNIFILIVSFYYFPVRCSLFAISSFLAFMSASAVQSLFVEARQQVGRLRAESSTFARRRLFPGDVAGTASCLQR